MHGTEVTDDAQRARLHHPWHAGPRGTIPLDSRLAFAPFAPCFGSRLLPQSRRDNQVFDGTLAEWRLRVYKAVDLGGLNGNLG